MVEESFVIAKYDYEAQEPHELGIARGERLKLIDNSHNWWKVVNLKGQTGFVPSNFVRLEGFIDRAKGTIRSLNGRSCPKIPDLVEQEAQKPVSKHRSGNKSGQMTELLCYAVAKFNYDPQREDELKISKGDHLTVVDKSSDGWWKGQLNGSVGWFPSNYVDETHDAPPQHFEQPAPIPQNVLSDIPNNYNQNFNHEFESPKFATNGFSNQPERILEIVVTLYSFEAQNAEELSFKKGERLDIVEHPAHDPDWYRARNSRGDVGLVPTNYIEIVERNPKHSAFQTAYPASTPSTSARPSYLSSLSGPYASQPWYYGTLSRDQSDMELNARGVEGDFLVRDSESNPGDYSISVKGNGRNKHFLVQVNTNTGSYKIGNRDFGSMQALIQHYMKSPIFSNDQTAERLYLVKPLPR
ncbi:unnamed protein product [Bursaphelenchus xylophilus]|uniref:(pine wood nematode) hypothetical protein n=1 Tax=Bursaphelenchus xylophilus TaxID=6326 RepID=A0A1I7RTZ2_BURXY|nr:unnamed protein product [Bursaphelenchus xylophilus]CAG9132077.1 unnamed protein product [Bursaphelenchus xylophilus]